MQIARRLPSRSGSGDRIESELELALDGRLLLRVGIELKNMLPLEACVDLAADLPISIPEMIVYIGGGRRELHGLFESPRGIIITTQTIIGPADGIRDEPVERPQRSRFFQHRHGFLEVFALVDPAIAEIVQHIGAIRVELEGGAEIAFGGIPA